MDVQIGKYFMPECAPPPTIQYRDRILVVSLIEMTGEALGQTHKVRRTLYANHYHQPPHGKTNNLHRRNKGADQLPSNCEADQHLCFRNTDSTIPLLSKSKISSLYPSSVTVQPGMCWTWSEPKLLVFSCTGSVISLRKLDVQH